MMFSIVMTMVAGIIVVIIVFLTSATPIPRLACLATPIRYTTFLLA